MSNSFLWRSMLYVPSNNQKFIAKANQRGADAIILDLEDSVPMSAKPEARSALAQTVRAVASDSMDILVRINRPLTEAIPDIIASTIKGVIAFMLPKIESAQHLRLLDEVVTAQEIQRNLEIGSIKFVPMIETANSYFRMEEIAVSSTRNVAMTLGGEDFALDTGMVPDQETLFMASQKLVYASRAAKILPIGTIGTVADYQDLKSYRKSAAKSKKFGFMGAACIHPGVVHILNEEFSPKEDEMLTAKRIVEAYEGAIASGKGAISLDGRMIDVPVAERARETLRQYSLIQNKNE